MRIYRLCDSVFIYFISFSIDVACRHPPQRCRCLIFAVNFPVITDGHINSIHFSTGSSVERHCRRIFKKYTQTTFSLVSFIEAIAPFDCSILSRIQLIASYFFCRFFFFFFIFGSSSLFRFFFLVWFASHRILNATHLPLFCWLM